jgi:hypothetical protein
MSFAPEDELIILCSRTSPREAGARAARALLEPDRDWGYVIETSIKHGVAPLVHHGLTSLLEQRDVHVPAWALAELGRLRATSAERNSRLYGVVGDVMDAFQAGGVRALGLKDLSLALELYPDPGLRPIGDLDILVPREDYEAAGRCLVRLGFERQPRADAPYARRYAVGSHFRRARADIWIDLQWNVMEREWDAQGCSARTFDVETMWRRSRLLTVASGGYRYELRAPGLEDMLYHLCHHAEGHDYSELILLCDIAELVEAKGDAIDWAAVVDTARRHEATASVRAALGLVERLFGVSAPQAALEEMRSHVLMAGAHQAIFGNLGSLHVALDDMDAVASPPAELMQRLERLVRGQASTARSLYEELRALAADVVQAGGELVVVDGTGSPRLFPDEVLPPFGNIRLLVVDCDRDLLLETCRRRGFDAASNTPQRLMKRLPVASGDPLARREPDTLVLDWDDDPRDPLRLRDASYSNRDAALLSLEGRLRRRSTDSTVRVRVAALPREELFLRLLAKAGTETHTVLFSLVALLDFLERSRAPIDPARLAAAGQRRGVAEGAARGLRLLEEVMPQQAAPAGPPPRALEWARYPAGALERYTLLRDAYLFGLCLLAARGMRERVRLIRSAVTARGGIRGAVAALARAAGAAVRQLTGSRTLSPGELAYWTRIPDTGSSPGPARAEPAAEHDAIS